MNEEVQKKEKAMMLRIHKMLKALKILLVSCIVLQTGFAIFIVIPDFDSWLGYEAKYPNNPFGVILMYLGVWIGQFELVRWIDRSSYIFNKNVEVAKLDKS